MRDFHNKQMTGSRCQGKNCAAAVTGMDIFFGTRGQVELNADQVRAASHVSCTPRVSTPSGGLSINHIESLCRSKGVDINFGRSSTSYYRRWNSTEVKSRLGTYYGGHLLGMYSTVKWPWRAKGSTFRGGHSLFAHDYRLDMKDSHYGKVQATVCWHDPLRSSPIRVPWSVVLAYTQTSSPLKGFVGWVKIPAIPGGTYAKPMTDRTRTAYDTVAVHSSRTVGKASTVRIIKPKGKLVEIAMYAPGQVWHGSTRWGALSLLGNRWIHLKRLNYTGGDT